MTCSGGSRPGQHIRNIRGAFASTNVQALSPDQLSPSLRVGIQTSVFKVVLVLIIQGVVGGPMMHVHHLGACWKCRLLGYTPDLLTQSRILDDAYVQQR